MTHPNSMAISDIEKKRAKAVVSSHFAKVIHSFTDPDTRAGIVVAEDTYPGINRTKAIKAYYFRPAQLNRSFENETLQSAHDVFQVQEKLYAKLAEEKRLKTAAHPLVVGDIIAAVWGVTMRDVNFYVVIDVPHPRKVTLASIQEQLVSGDWMAGEKMPIIPDVMPTKGTTYGVKMDTGEAKVDMKSSITHARKWSGKPVSVHSD